MLASGDMTLDNRDMSDAAGFEQSEPTEAYDERMLRRTSKFVGAVDLFLKRQEAAPLEEIDPRSLRKLLEAYKLKQKLDGALLGDEARADIEKDILYAEALEAYMFDLKAPKEVFQETAGGKQWRREKPDVYYKLDPIRNRVAEQVAEFIVDQRDRQVSLPEVAGELDVKLGGVLVQIKDDRKISDTTYLGMLYLFELFDKPVDKLSPETQDILRLCKAEASKDIRTKIDAVTGQHKQALKWHLRTLNQLVGNQRNTLNARPFADIVREEMHRSRNDDEEMVRGVLQNHLAVALDSIYSYSQER